MRMAAPMRLHDLPRTTLAALPTPIEPLPNLSAFLDGPDILVKRDDTTTLALGGNKARKLEFLIADAIEQGADAVITAGGVQSNHCMLTAAAAARKGLRCELVLNTAPPKGVPKGNLLLDSLLGAGIHWTDPETRCGTMEKVADLLRNQGWRPYIIPVGGSNAIGAAGYVAAMLELTGQLTDMVRQVDHVVFATSSGGTHVGIQLGARITGFEGQILGISIDQTTTDGYPEELAAIANIAAERLDVQTTFYTTDFAINAEYLGGGYGVVGDLEREAITLVARHEGLFVDPVYTGRTMGGLIDMIRRGVFRKDETVLFWHTGGVPALFAYAEELLG